MKVVQTFWSGRKKILEDGYGWQSPKHHIMSWALSSLCLRENYNEVVLYTDSTGYIVFHEALQLPYTRYEVLYDGIKCKPEHWAYPKLITYSLQEKPFIHVDGDVFLSHRLNQEIESRGLIAQNREIGTLYYKNMMPPILTNSLRVSEMLFRELAKDSISSYNMGVFGGNDIEFIKEYCKAAFEYINDNRINVPENEAGNVNQNIVFEQILFYVLVTRHNKHVSTIIDHPLFDNGYTVEDFCDFRKFGQNTLMHIIGGHKRNLEVCRMLECVLQERYPETFNKIQQLFT